MGTDGTGKSVKGKRHICIVGMCPPLQGDAELMKGVIYDERHLNDHDLCLFILSYVI